MHVGSEEISDQSQQKKTKTTVKDVPSNVFITIIEQVFVYCFGLVTYLLNLSIFLVIEKDSYLFIYQSRIQDPVKYL